MAWTGKISLNDITELKDICICDACAEEPLIAKDVTLRFLSIVETSRIPLYLSVGPPCTVSTSNDDTQRWFCSTLLQHERDSGNGSGSAWWHTARPDSPHGVLVSVELPGSNVSPSKPRVTEILFYASHNLKHGRNLPTPPRSSPAPEDATGEAQSQLSVSVNALLLSSDLLEHCNSRELTPPSSPVNELLEAVFLPALATSDREIINEPPVRKRRTANDAFDEANERRKKARRKVGEGVAAAAAPKPDKSILPLQHRRSASINQAVALQTRPLSRSPSVASSRPATANKPSTLSRSESSAALQSESVIERKNRDLISRIVMTGMRLHGLTQRKKRSNSSALSPAMDEDDLETVEFDRKNDEEYKLIYHQVFKATCLAFRAAIQCESLHPYPNQIREVVDQLLVIFCTNPLIDGLPRSDDKLTPGGRKAFATSEVMAAPEKLMQLSVT